LEVTVDSLTATSEPQALKSEERLAVKKKPVVVANPEVTLGNST